MEPNGRFNEDQFQILWAEGLDPLTAAAASYEAGDERQPANSDYRRSFDLGLIVGLVLFIAYHLM